jgi:hypothetical protein
LTRLKQWKRAPVLSVVFYSVVLSAMGAVVEVAVTLCVYGCVGVGVLTTSWRLICARVPAPPSSCARPPPRPCESPRPGDERVKGVR